MKAKRFRKDFRGYPVYKVSPSFYGHNEIRVIKLAGNYDGIAVTAHGDDEHLYLEKSKKTAVVSNQAFAFEMMLEAMKSYAHDEEDFLMSLGYKVYGKF